MRIDSGVCFFAFSFIIFISCAQKPLKSRSEIYSHNSINLLNDLLELDENKNCDCVLEPSNQSMIEKFKIDVPSFEFKNYIVTKLKLQNKTELDSIYGLSEKLVLIPSLLKSTVKLVTRKEYDSIFNKYEFRKANQIIFETYPTLCYFTKPIFDKNFEKGLIDLNTGTIHLITVPPKVKLVQGQWNYDWN